MLLVRASLTLVKNSSILKHSQHSGMQHLSGSTDSELQVSRRILLSRGDSQKGPSGGVGGGTGTEHQDCSGN